MLTLIDLSNNNPPPTEFAKVKAHGVYGTWLKVTEGITFTDDTFQSRARAARAAGLHVGGYHFARPHLSDPFHQAGRFAQALGQVQRRDLHPVLDLEDAGDLDAPSLHAWARTFLSHAHLLCGVKLITYMSPGFIGRCGWRTTFGTGAGLWLADYGINDGHDHGATAPRPWHKIVAHQYTSLGTVPGIPGHVDLTHARARRHILAHGLRGIL